MDAVLGHRGQCSAQLRQAAFRRAAQLTRGAEPAAGELPDELARLVDKVTRHAYRVTDEDTAALLALGHGQEELFEIIVVAAVGAGVTRQALGLEALAAWQAGGENA